MSRLLLRSKKKRLIKKHWKKTGNLPGKFLGKKDGMYWYSVVLPPGIVYK